MPQRRLILKLFMLASAILFLPLPTVAATTTSYQGIWWASPAGSESGWGINFTHQGDVIFATWFTYGASGRALWLVGSLVQATDGTYVGDLYQATGPVFSAVPFNPALVTRTRVGIATLSFTGASVAMFNYTVNGVTQTKTLTPQVFGTLPTCTLATQASLANASNYSGLWWASPAESESGWGLNVAQQGDIVFATWFTYDSDGAPLWLVGSELRRTQGANFSGKLYRTTGPAFDSVPFDPARVALTEVGTATLGFSNGSAGSFVYTVNGITQTKSITQQIFRDLVSVCSASGGLTNPATTTAGVQCAYSYSGFNSSPSVNATSTSSWSCNSTSRTLSANGIPDHAVGTFPNPDNPNAISARAVTATYTLTPAIVSSTGNFAMTVGHALNGIKIEPDTGGTCDNSGTSCSLIGGTGAWRMEALGQTAFRFGTDTNNAHVQPTGEYHYHGMPEGFLAKLGRGMAMTLIGWAADGFPIYARYGYADAANASSAIKVMRGSYRTKATPDAGRPSTSLYAMGTFKQDYEYVAGLGDLDECNGRLGVTPEFPTGIYHYYATDTYPFMPRCVKGTAAGGGGGPPPPNG